MRKFIFILISIVIILTLIMIIVGIIGKIRLSKKTLSSLPLSFQVEKF
jgi:hypothetical protein